MRLRALGGLKVEGSTFNRPKSLLLLAYLAVEGARERRHLRELFWPGAADAAGSLRVVVAQLRGVHSKLLKDDGTRLALGVPSDVEALIAAMRDDPSNVGARYTGAFLEDVVLPDWSAELEEWVLLTREFLAGQVQGHLLRIAEEQYARRNVSVAAELAGQAWQLRGAPPMDTDDLGRVHALFSAGHSSLKAAVRREVQELGLQLPVEVPAALILKRSEHLGMPTMSTVFIGRHAELLDLRALLSDPEVRLLTLLGPGGIGKTRLAVEAVGTVAKGGIVYVALETVSEAAQVIGVVATTLGQSFTDRVDALQSVIRAVGDQLVLLVLDNVEQVRGMAEDLAALLEACPSLTVMTTSREALEIGWETVYPVPGLEITAQEDADAVRLFTNRARRANARFRLTPQSLPAVVEICRRVDGSPLALELAAPWIRTLPIEQVAEAVGRDAELLEGAVPGVSARHRSIRSVFEQSWARLSQEQQELLSGLSVFYGGFTREAAAAVLGATLPHLLGLVASSFLKVDARGRFDRHPLLFEFIREKLEADPDRQKCVELAHARHFQMGSDAAYDANYTGLNLTQQLSWLHVEFDNIQAALVVALKYGEIELGLWLCRNQSIQWWSRNQSDMALDYYEMFLSRLGAHLDGTPVHAWSLIQVASTINANDAYSQADEANFRRGFEIAIKSRQGALINRALTVEANICLRARRDPAAYMKLMVGVIQSSDCHELYAASIEDRANLADIHLSEMDIQTAKALLTDGLAICNQHNLEFSRAQVLSTMSNMLRYVGDYPLAEKIYDIPHHKESTTNTKFIEEYYHNLAQIYFERSRSEDDRLGSDLRLARHYVHLSMNSRMGWRMPVEVGSPLIGNILTMEGNTQEAANYCRRGLGDNQRHGPTRLTSAWHLSLGTALLYQGNCECHHHFRLALAHQPSKTQAVAVLDQIAVALGTFGPAQMAPTLWGAVAQIRLEKGVVRPPIWMEQYEQMVAHVTSQIGQSNFDAAWEIGTTLSLSGTLDFALTHLPS